MDVRFVDTHAHINIPTFADDFAAVATQCAGQGVGVINVGTEETSSARAVELANQYDHLHAIIGLHPVQAVPGNHDQEREGKAEVFNPDFYRALAKNKKVVGIGECGFDYWHTEAESFAMQEEAFIAQIMLANELELPLMIHTRGPKPGQESPTRRSVYKDVYETLKQYAKVPFNIHFYAGTIPEAEKFFELGGTISFTGVITFAKDYEEVVQHAPLELIHGETDCPYVAPIPHRGKRCEPWMVQEVYKKIATIKGLDEEEVREQLVKNARKHYNL
jgi:TatD DNase family protein